MRYAKAVISRYDEDKDGELSNDETKKMCRPPVGAGADKDGFIFWAELLSHFLLSKYEPDKDGKLSQTELVDRLKGTFGTSPKKAERNRTPKYGSPYSSFPFLLIRWFQQAIKS